MTTCALPDEKIGAMPEGSPEHCTPLTRGARRLMTEIGKPQKIEERPARDAPAETPAPAPPPPVRQPVPA